MIGLDELAAMREVAYDGDDKWAISDDLFDWLQNNPKKKRVRQWLVDIFKNPHKSSSIIGILEDDRSGVRGMMDSAESPIELMMAAWLCNEIHHYNSRQTLFGSVTFEVTPQQKIRINGQDFRLDFLVTVKLRHTGGEMASYVSLECDGHDFHEKTKEQAARDKNRDRLIQSAGIPVLRFTGSEIYEGRTSLMSQALIMCYNTFANAHGVHVQMPEIVWG